jgi:hypothetical protein
LLLNVNEICWYFSLSPNNGVIEVELSRWSYRGGAIEVELSRWSYRGGAIEVELARNLNETQDEDKEWTEDEWARFVTSVKQLPAGERLDWQRERRKVEVGHGPLS